MKAAIAPVTLILGICLIGLSFFVQHRPSEVLSDKELEEYSAAVGTREAVLQGTATEADLQKSSEVANEKKLKLEAGNQRHKFTWMLFRGVGVVFALAGGGYYLWLKSQED